MSSLDRRRFHELSAAALGGLVAGTLAGCGEQPAVAPAGQAAAGELHLCRGLNQCKNQGTSGRNDCRGQGTCATLASHECGGHNDCKGQGGCGADVGLNECKGKGGCQVPLMEPARKTVRQRMEVAWAKAGEDFGTPPEVNDK